jgi:hypothetical protein
MGRIIKRLLLATLACVVVLVAAYSVQANRRTRALDQITAGDTAASVIERLGQPTTTELPDKPYLLYSDHGCAAPCATRLWWEGPFLRGMEAWSVELDASGKVVKSAHWVSP